mmetsp:Transcript_77922/g.240579  ORF Transcript_77922/g.240579 Transcript_77922/m.240579 type:complete len:305 (-) Transcript_77922:4-918(-)
MRSLPSVEQHRLQHKQEQAPATAFLHAEAQGHLRHVPVHHRRSAVPLLLGQLEVPGVVFARSVSGGRQPRGPGGVGLVHLAAFREYDVRVAGQSHVLLGRPRMVCVQIEEGQAEARQGVRLMGVAVPEGYLQVNMSARHEIDSGKLVELAIESGREGRVRRDRVHLHIKILGIKITQCFPQGANAVPDALRGMNIRALVGKIVADYAGLRECQVGRRFAGIVAGAARLLLHRQSGDRRHGASSADLAVPRQHGDAEGQEADRRQRGQGRGAAPPRRVLGPTLPMPSHPCGGLRSGARVAGELPR